MPRPLPADYVKDDEHVILEERRQPRSIVDNLIGILITWILVMVGFGFLVRLITVEQYWTFVWIPWTIATLLAVWSALLVYWRMATSLYVITDDRVYKAFGRFRFNLALTTYDKVTDMQVHQSLFGRIWDFGTVTVETAGSGVAMEGVRSPFRFKHEVEQARDAMIRRLMEEFAPRLAAREAEQTEAASEGEVAGEPIWTGKPSPASFGASLVGVVVPFAFLVVFGLGMAFVDAWLSLAVVGGSLLFLALIVWALYIQYRYTRYELHADGVVVTRGWLSRHRVETTFDKVTDVTTHQDILGRVFDYGRITVNTAGSNQAPVNFQGMRDPDGVKRLIDEARRKRR